MIRAKRGYIEYRSGQLPIILGVPHGGKLRPAHVPKRDFGCWDSSTRNCLWTHSEGGRAKDQTRCVATAGNDVYTVPLSKLIAKELHKLTGRTPYMVINNLHRSKIDLNRPIDEATFGVTDMVNAWQEFHCLINKAKMEIGGVGLYLDIHGQSHPEGWIELGYAIDKEDLDRGNINQFQSSITNLARRTSLPLEQLISGKDSFGAYLQKEGYKAVPSPDYPIPSGGNFFPGGYNVRVHGSYNGGPIDAFQIESPINLRNKQTAPAYAAALARCLCKYLKQYYGVEY